MSTENMEVRWFRSKFSSPVHLYRDQKDQYVQQMAEYRGRTELLKDGMADGRVALKIRNIRFSDAGWYSCFFRSNVSYEEALIELKLAVNFTLDPDTAHPELILSEDQKSVYHGDIRQNLPNNPERFDYSAIVLGSERFTAGKHYWEVEVKDKTNWDLGVCLENVDRKKKIIASPTKGYWVIVQRAGGTYKALTEDRISITVKVKPKQIGIFLDCGEGKVSFYNVTDGSQMYTFNAKFTRPVRPFFSPWYNEDGKNASPLKICHVRDWE
ncbi:Erythroid membrane-associated protein [Chelonia mydas]|uniref:Erythroid membrane-associated protein n=1 Tax=Chelonia mydas TaxID=8469 RepID=M7B1E6_CHEMY|nr:Erythroid membrane-associated protein [Chelonia mydas]